MCVYVCMYVCMYVRTYVCMYVCMHCVFVIKCLEKFIMQSMFLFCHYNIVMKVTLCENNNFFTSKSLKDIIALMLNCRLVIK